MKKVVLSATMVFLLLSGTVAGSFSGDTLVRVYGKILNQKDSSGIISTVLYEKLPYYDDMGMIRSTMDGSFECYLIKGEKYGFRVNKLEGFQPWEREILITDVDGDGENNVNFFIPPEESEELIRLENLVFARGSANIQESSFSVLDDFITYVNERPNVQIQLEGHTDFAGNPDANMRLSQARVESVAEYLVKKGIKKGRITTKAFGGTEPLTMERTDEAKQMNRRVEVRLRRPQ